MVKVQQRGLGKGLSALISENYSNAAPEAEPQGQSAAQKHGELPIHRVVAGRFQPRTRFTEAQLHELSESIERNGVMQPILVRRTRNAGEEGFEIVAGERRWRAAAMAGLKTIPAIVHDLTDQQALELAIIENVQRADLTPIEEATGYQRLMEEFGHTQEELSKILGKSRSHIANLLRLLALPDDIRALVDDGKLSMGHARALLGAHNASALAQGVVQKGLSVRQTEALARVSQGQPGQPRPRNAAGKRLSQMDVLKRSVDALEHKSDDILSLEETLSSSLGMHVMINDRGQEGEVVIGYTSLSQLDELLKCLGGGTL